MDQDQLNPYVANEGYLVRVPHNPFIYVEIDYLKICRHYLSYFDVQWGQGAGSISFWKILRLKVSLKPAARKF